MERIKEQQQLKNNMIEIQFDSDSFISSDSNYFVEESEEVPNKDADGNAQNPIGVQKYVSSLN